VVAALILLVVTQWNRIAPGLFPPAPPAVATT